MKNSTNKEIIIGALLESPKTNGELAIKCGYVDGKYGEYHSIEKDLKTLEQYGYIHKIPAISKRPGRPATWYDIVYEFPILREILKKYPNLHALIQKNDMIKSMLAKKNNWLWPLSECDDNFLVKKYFDELSELSEKCFKENLIMSKCFFDLFFMNDYADLEIRFYNLTYLSNPDQKNEHFQKGSPIVKDYGTLKTARNLTMMLDIFTVCVYADVLSGYVNPTAIETVRASKLNPISFPSREKEYKELIDSIKKYDTVGTEYKKLIESIKKHDTVETGYKELADFIKKHDTEYQELIESIKKDDTVETGYKKLIDFYKKYDIELK